MEVPFRWGKGLRIQPSPKITCFYYTLLHTMPRKLTRFTRKRLFLVLIRIIGEHRDNSIRFEAQELDYTGTPSLPKWFFLIMTKSVKARFLKLSSFCSFKFLESIVTSTFKKKARNLPMPLTHCAWQYSLVYPKAWLKLKTKWDASR